MIVLKNGNVGASVLPLLVREPIQPRYRQFEPGRDVAWRLQARRVDARERWRGRKGRRIEYERWWVFPAQHDRRCSVEMAAIQQTPRQRVRRWRIAGACGIKHIGDQP